MNQIKDPTCHCYDVGFLTAYGMPDSNDPCDDCWPDRLLTCSHCRLLCCRRHRSICVECCRLLCDVCAGRRQDYPHRGACFVCRQAFCDRCVLSGPTGRVFCTKHAPPHLKSIGTVGYGVQTKNK
jgi:hypothetical protein